jgi:hypothetical protein
MAAPPALRNSTNQLLGFAKRDLAALWREVSDAAQARTALMDLLPAIVTTYGAAAATLAATWYDDAREKAAVRGSFTAIPVEPGDRGAQALAGWASSQANDLGSMQTLILGGLQRRIADNVRGTIAGSSIADPSAHGWAREGSGGCTSGFCDMLIARGAVYTEASADFASHDHCQCFAVPAFDGLPRPVKPYTPSLRGSTEADRARTREYIASH